MHSEEIKKMYTAFQKQQATMESEYNQQMEGIMNKAYKFAESRFSFKSK